MGRTDPQRIPSLKDIVAIPPINAWLLIGDEASYPTATELRKSRKSWEVDATWTGPRQAQPGDLLFFYFMAPRKAIHFVARAVTYSKFDPTAKVNAHRKVSRNQWWVTHTPLVEIAPLPFRELQTLMGGYLNLKGRPTHYIPPNVAGAVLEQRIVRRSPNELDRATLRTPVGDPALPDPARMRLPAWARMADGPFKLESQVERHIVEPLLRLAYERTKAVTWKKGCRIEGGGIPDYVVLRGDKATGVVEVKLGIGQPRNGVWTQSPDFNQVMRYSNVLRVPAALIDSNRIFLIPTGGVTPSKIVRRNTATAGDLLLIGRHLSG